MFEYKVIPAPNKGKKQRGVKTSKGRFAHAINDVLNEMAKEGWEYLRAETLPSEERSGLFKQITAHHNILVFRRAVQSGAPKVETDTKKAAANTKKLNVDDSAHASTATTAPSLPSATDANESTKTAPPHAPAAER